MAEAVQQNKPVAQNKAAEAPAPTVVRLEKLTFVGSVKKWNKQSNESQVDSFGKYQREVTLVGPKGEKYTIQKKGEVVEGLMPTIQRHTIKLLVAAYFTHGTQKGEAYLDTLAYNMDRVKPFLENASTGGWIIDASYGNPTGNKVNRLYAPIKDILALLSTSLKVQQTTREKYPPAVEVQEVAVAQDVKEEVTFQF